MSTIGADLLRGNTDTILLRFLNEGDSYGYAINKRTAELTDGQYQLNEATLYTSFKRLQNAGYIRSYWGDEDHGARRRYYAITEEGKEAYRRNLEEFEEALEMLGKLMK